MVKRRPVILISRYRRFDPGTCTIVPLSKTAPRQIETHHYKMPEGILPAEMDNGDSWVKCDMIDTVCYQRLNLVRTKWVNRQWQYFTAVLPSEVMAGIQDCVRHALYLHN